MITIILFAGIIYFILKLFVKDNGTKIIMSLYLRKAGLKEICG